MNWTISFVNFSPRSAFVSSFASSSLIYVSASTCVVLKWDNFLALAQVNFITYDGDLVQPAFSFAILFKNPLADILTSSIIICMLSFQLYIENTNRS